MHDVVVQGFHLTFSEMSLNMQTCGFSVARLFAFDHVMLDSAAQMQMKPHIPDRAPNGGDRSKSSNYKIVLVFGLCLSGELSAKGNIVKMESSTHCSEVQTAATFPWGSSESRLRSLFISGIRCLAPHCILQSHVSTG